MPMAKPGLTLDGRRFLFVGEEGVVTQDLREELESQGAMLVGPVSWAQAVQGPLGPWPIPDAALLDLDLEGETAPLLTEVLLARRIPILLLTTGQERLDRYADLPFVEKPFGHPRLVQTLRCLLDHDLRDECPAGVRGIGCHQRRSPT